MAGGRGVADIPVTFLALSNNLWHNPHMFRNILKPGMVAVVRRAVRTPAAAPKRQVAVQTSCTVTATVPTLSKV